MPLEKPKIDRTRPTTLKKIQWNIKYILTSEIKHLLAQLAGAVDYTNFISAEG